MKNWVRILLLSLLGVAVLLFGMVAYYYVPDIPLEVLNKKYEVTADEYVHVNGLSVHYKQEGPITDTLPLVLLHGTSSSLYTWDGWTKELKTHRRIIRLDLPGFGLTGPHPQGKYSVESYLEFLEVFLLKLGVKHCTIAGNSLGGEIAWRYALEHPRQVKNLILIGAAGYPIEIEDIPLSKIPLSYLWLRAPVLRELSVKFTSREVIRKSLEYLYGDAQKVGEPLVSLYFDMMCREGNREALTERMEVIGEPAPWEKLSMIKAPTLIIWGGKDRLIPEEYARRFHADLPNSQLRIFPNAGHMTMEEIPQETVKVAEEFLKGNTKLEKEVLVESIM